MQRIYLERHDAAKNKHRFYQMYVTPGIFGDWSLVREWGRVGSPGTVRKNRIFRASVHHYKIKYLHSVILTEKLCSEIILHLSQEAHKHRETHAKHER